MAIDAAIRDAELVAFHPNVNTATLVVGGDDFRQFLAAVGHERALDLRRAPPFVAGVTSQGAPQHR